MADYGHDLLFGTFLTPTAAQPERVVQLAQLTEQSASTSSPSRTT